jgi:ATP-dependent Lon protease
MEPGTARLYPSSGKQRLSCRLVPEIGLFPLALVLLPTERVPLHIFEPRYKELIGECLAEGREFGLLLEDGQGRREIGTRAEVVEVLQVFDDGRMNIVVEGHDRFRLVGVTREHSYITGEIEGVEDQDEEPPGPAQIEETLALFRRLVEAAEADVDEPEGSGRSLSFELAARVDFGLEPKQELLELRSESARLRRLCELLERAVEAVARERAVRNRAQTNGRVSTWGEPGSSPETSP